jgi:tellurite resistance protein TehA-like permease
VHLCRITLQPHTLSSLTGVLVLPIVTLVVASATGAVLCGVLPASSDAIYRTLIGSYAMWGIGFPFANTILVLYFLRLLVYKVPLSSTLTKWPNRADIMTILLPIGPLGQGSFAIMNLGTMAKKVHSCSRILMQAEFISSEKADIFYSASLVLGLIIWGWALVWIFMAFTGTIIKLRDGKIPFNLGWWATTFPLGKPPSPSPSPSPLPSHKLTRRRNIRSLLSIHRPTIQQRHYQNHLGNSNHSCRNILACRQREVYRRDYKRSLIL